MQNIHTKIIVFESISNCGIPNSDAIPMSLRESSNVTITATSSNPLFPAGNKLNQIDVINPLRPSDASMRQ